MLVMRQSLGEDVGNYVIGGNVADNGLSFCNQVTTYKVVLALDVLGMSAELRILAEDDGSHVVIAQVSGQLLRVSKLRKECAEPREVLAGD